MVLFVQRETQPETVLLTPFAEGRPWACLNAPHAEAYCRPGRHSQVCPDGINIFFFKADDRNSRSTGHFQCRRAVFLGYISYFTERFRADHAARDMRRYGISLFIALNDYSLFSIL